MATPTQRDVRDYSSQTARLRLEQLKATPPACRLCIQWHSSGTTMVGSQGVNLDVVGKYFCIVFERLKVAGGWRVSLLYLMPDPHGATPEELSTARSHYTAELERE
ncbi:hypothetical protein BKA70DRAFT_1227649 [Coprinopsis sp. MPI-PUGE-AT-0042]|nr:hypothetical protein BKA70DRAFT_1227649 [Coprinopsis sp. MPI-PUGE-AT-0042]